MDEFYLYLLNRAGSLRKSFKYSVSPALRHAQYFMLLLTMLLTLSVGTANAQTILIDPAAEGGFESGATFAANGWSVSNSANNPWVIGTAVTTSPFAGNSAYISNNSGVANVYTPDNDANNFFWRAITVPAGQTKIALTFKWSCQGESNWDNWQVFYAPTTVVPVASAAHPGSGTTTVPAGIAGATFIGFGQSVAGVQTATYTLPAALAGTTFRLIFSWKNETSGTQPPAAIDGISLTSQAPGNYISIASGNWSSPATWDLGSVPNSSDNATIASAHTVTIDAAGQSINNIAVDGTLSYTATPTSFAIAGNLTVNAGGAFNVFNGAIGKTATIAGNFVNNGTVDVSVGTGATGNLTFTGANVQTISGGGVFVNGIIRNLVFNNTSVAIPNINWSVNNISVDNTLNISNAKINLGTNKLTSGTSMTSTGTFTFTNGGFMSGGKFSRWWTAGATGYTTASPSAIPTGQAGRYPFYSPTGDLRVFYLGRTLPTAGGQFAVTYNGASTITTGLSITDGTYAVTDRWDGHFDVTAEGTAPAAQSYFTTIFAPNVFYPVNGVGRVLSQSAALSGTHLNSTAGGSAQRSGVSFSDLTSATGLYVGFNASDLLFVSTASGDWNNPAIWNKGTVPACTDAVTITAGTTVTVSTAANVAKSLVINAGGTAVVSSGDLQIGCTLNNNFISNNGTLTVSGGLLTVNGSLNNSSSTAVFNQSGGTIRIDGNDAGIAANSVASGTALFGSVSTNISLTGGLLLFVDPHTATTNTNGLAISLNNPTVSTATLSSSALHTTQFGDGVSTDAGGHANGFYVNNWAGSAYLALGNIVVEGGAGTNRKVSSVYALTANGNVEVTSASNLTADSLILGGNLTVNTGGEFVNTASVNCSRIISNTSNNLIPAPVTNAQTFTNNGTISNLAVNPTANLGGLTVNNTNAAGLTLASPFSISGTLGLSEGKVNTTATNVLTVGTAATAGSVSGGSDTAYVNGPLKRTIASGNANTAFVFYPVGKATYAPIWVAPATTSVAVIKAESFDSNTGTADAAIVNLSTDKRWEAPVVSGTVTDVNVRLGSATIIDSSIPVQAPSAIGMYTNAFGSLATYVAATGVIPNTTQSTTPSAGYTGYLSFAKSNICSGVPVPGNTLASSTQICSGTNVSFSLENSTSGTGVTYVWESSTDGTVYTPIVGAITATYAVVPTADTYYRAKVTCGGGTDTGTSTPVHVTFNNTITTTAASRCGVGTVDLSAVASSGATVKWYDAATGGNIVGTASPFTTPVISATTTYYAQAETTSAGSLSVGAGIVTSSAAAMPFNGGYGSLKGQYIITAAELNTAGLRAGSISGLNLDFTSVGGPFTNFEMSVGATTLASFPAGGNIQGGLTTVYTAATFTPVIGVNSFAFGTPGSFSWDGTSNIIVSICWTYGATATSGSAAAVKADTVPGGLNMSQSYRKDNEGSPCAFTGSVGAGTSNYSLSAVRPRITFNGQVVCASPRVATIATVATPPVLTLSAAPAAFCEGQSSAPLTVVTGATDYDTYTWSPATGVSGDAVSGWVFNPTVTTTYTLTASQLAGALCTSVNTVIITVNPLPSAIEATNAEVCLGSIIPMPVSGGAVAGTKIIGTATDLTQPQEQPTAFNNRWSAYTSQTIYTKAELQAAGIKEGPISGLSYNVTTLGDAATNANFTVKIGATSGANFASTAFLSTAAFTTVFGPQTYTHTATGWNTIAFTTPFIWDGESNIVIQTSMNGADSTNNAQTYFTATTDSKVLWANSLTATTGTLSNNRLNVRLNAAVAGVMVWSPITNLYTDAAATVPYTGTEVVAEDSGLTIYVKPAVVGPITYTVTSADPITSCAVAPASVVITANALPTVVITDPTAVCSPATVDLTAAAVTAGSDTGLTFSYFSDMNATISIDGSAVASSGTYYIKAINTSDCAVIVPVTATVNALPTVVVTNPVAVCAPSMVDLTAAAVTAGSDAGLTFSYFADAGATTSIDGSAITSSGTYFIKAANATGCFVIAPVTVTVNAAPSLVIANPAAVCSPATVDITVAAVTAGSDAGLSLSYWADPNATVTFPNPDAISGSGTYFIKATNGSGCFVILPVSVTVGGAPNLVITNPAAVCSPATVDITAAAVVAGSDAGLTYSYWADPNAAVTFPAPDAIVNSGTFYIKATSTGGCFVILPVSVVVNVTAAPSGEEDQDFTGGDTLADFTVAGTQIIWYDATTNGNVLPSSTVIVSGMTYYASQTIGGCESTVRLAVTAGIDLKTPGFDLAKLSYYPNPVSDVLTINYSDTIDSIEIYNLLGQSVYKNNFAAQEVKVDMARLASGSYIINVVSKGLVKNIKIIKK